MWLFVLFLRISVCGIVSMTVWQQQMHEANFLIWWSGLWLSGWDISPFSRLLWLIWGHPMAVLPHTPRIFFFFKCFCVFFPPLFAVQKISFCFFFINKLLYIHTVISHKFIYRSCESWLIWLKSPQLLEERRESLITEFLPLLRLLLLSLECCWAGGSIRKTALC